MPAKQNAKKTSTANPALRVGTRKRVAKVLDDYVDVSFSESDLQNLYRIPLPPTENRRPPKTSKTSANTDQSFRAGNIFTFW